MIINTKDCDCYVCNDNQELDVLRDIIEEKLGQDCIILLNKISIDYRENLEKQINIYGEELGKYERELDGYLQWVRSIRDEITGIGNTVLKCKKIETQHKLDHLVRTIDSNL